MFTRPDSQQELDRAVELWDQGGSGIGGRWHALTGAGFELVLATPTQMTTARAAIDQAAQAEDDRQRAEHLRQVAEQTPPWLFPTDLPTAVGTAPDAA